MRPVARAVAAGALLLGSVGAFVCGGALQARVLATPRTLSGAAAVADGQPGPDGATSASRTNGAPGVDVGRLGTAMSTALRSHAAEGATSDAYVETPELRADRHRTLDRQLTAMLGTISPEKRAALHEYNDEAIQVQMGLQAALLKGALGQADYDAQLHQRIVVQLDQLRALVTDDEYRKLTGLEPGVDPYEYMRTGVGGAPRAEGALAASDEPGPTEN